MPLVRPTPQTYTELQVAYTHFNDVLYGGLLPECLMTLQRKRGCFGYFSPQRFVSASGSMMHELAMHPGYFGSRPLEVTLSTLVHEMTHVWQFVSGTPGRRGYHNRQWATHIASLGLYPSETGQPGGAEVGEHMSHYILPDGAFLKATRRLLATDFRLSWYDRLLPAVQASGICGPGEEPHVPYHVPDGETFLAPPRAVAEQQFASVSKSPSRRAYRCPACGSQVWGRTGLRLACLPCDQVLVESAR